MSGIDPKLCHLVTLGCAKNAVDSDSMAQLLAASGYRLASSPDGAGVLIVNTCGFIGPARDESIAVLRDLAARKRSGQLLIAAGCLTQRYGAEVARDVPGVDGILGTRRWMDVVDVVASLRDGQRPVPLYHLPDVATVGRDDAGALRATVQGASAYLKIADGCRRPCAFCAIPLIKGTAVSRSPEAIEDEARQLQARGVKEIILIAQDTTDYGHDLGMSDGLAALLERLIAAAPEVPWIRLMYAYPGCVTDHLIELMSSEAQIVPYLDLPLQHASPQVLKRMRRPPNMDRVRSNLDKIRRAVPGVALRTTFIVGYPGETESDFQLLMDFVEEVHFDRVGAFEFSFERGTESESLGDPVPAELKRERYERLMVLQQAISLQRNQSFVGRTLDVLVEGAGDGVSLGRSYRDAPEIDGLVVLDSEVPVGTLVPTRITGALNYDLTGQVQLESVDVAL